MPPFAKPKLPFATVERFATWLRHNQIGLFWRQHAGRPHLYTTIAPRDLPDPRMRGLFAYGGRVYPSFELDARTAMLLTRWWHRLPDDESPTLKQQKAVAEMIEQVAKRLVTPTLPHDVHAAGEDYVPTERQRTTAH